MYNAGLSCQRNQQEWPVPVEATGITVPKAVKLGAGRKNSALAGTDAITRTEESATYSEASVNTGAHEGIRAKLTLFKDKYYWKEDVDRRETDWFRFQKAVKAHERYGVKLLQPLFQKMGVDLTVAWGLL